MAAIGVPSYLAALVDSYLTDRRLWWDTDNGTKENVVSAGVPYIMYNDVLNVPVVSEVTIVGCADEIAVIVVAKNLADLELYSSEAITAIKKWLEDAGLSIAEDKTAVLITKRRKETTARIRMGKHIIPSNPAIKYLGVMIDARLKVALAKFLHHGV